MAWLRAGLLIGASVFTLIWLADHKTPGLDTSGVIASGLWSALAILFLPFITRASFEKAWKLGQELQFDEAHMEWIKSVYGRPVKAQWTPPGGRSPVILKAIPLEQTTDSKSGQEHSK